LVPVKDKKGKNVYKEDADFEFGTAKTKQKYKSDILPPKLVIQKYFAAEQTAIDAIQTNLDTATQALEGYVEENTGEDGLLEEAKNDAGNINAASLKARIKGTDDAAELKTLKKCLALITQESGLKSGLKKAIAALELLTFKKIPTIPLDEVKTLVIHDKWLATIASGINDEIERMTQQLANRVKLLEERYADTLPGLDKDVIDYAARVEDHLKKMGLSW